MTLRSPGHRSPRSPSLHPVRLAGLVFLGAALMAPAARADWRPFGLQGIQVRTLESAPGRLCAGTNGQGVFCIDRRLPREGWQPIGLDGLVVTDLWIDPERTDVIFAAADQGANRSRLSRSLDGGRTWEPIGDRLLGGYGVVARVAGVPGSPTVYAAGGAVWRSDDLGETWRTVLDQAWQYNLEVAPTDPQTVWSAGDLAFAFVPEAILYLTRNGGVDWDYPGIWLFDYTPLIDIAAHPGRDGLVLTGHGGFVNRTDDHGATFDKVIESPGYLFADWSPHGRAGEPAVPLALAVVWNTTGSIDLPLTWISRDLGKNWTPRGGDALRALRINDLETDHRWPGLAWVATSDGVQIYFGAGRPLCHFAIDGVENMFLLPGLCPPIMGPILSRPGDIIAAERDMVRMADDRTDLGAVHCLLEDGDVVLSEIEPPDPPPGEILLILSRAEGEVSYGQSTAGLPRVASAGDCL